MTTRSFHSVALVPPHGQTCAPLPVSTAERLPLGPLPVSRYPDPHIEALDKRFKGSPGTGAVERIATGFRWAEGPAYFRAGGYLIFSDLPNNRMMRLLEDDNHLSVFRSPSYNSNGNTVDRQGRLITCQHAGRRVVRTEFDGRIVIVADRFEGKRFTLGYAANDKLLAALPAEVTEGLISYAPSPDLTGAAFKKVQSIVGANPDPYSCQTFDHANLAILAIAKAGAATGAAIHDAVRAVGNPAGREVSDVLEGIAALKTGEINYSGASGPCKFTDIGDITGCKFRFDVVEKSQNKLIELS